MKKVFLSMVSIFLLLTISKATDIGDIADEVDLDAKASISIEPSYFNFTTIVEGCESMDVPFFVYNDGGTAVYIKDVDIVGDDSEDFKITEDNCKGKIISIDDTCAIYVRFKPKSKGTKKAKLRVEFIDYDKFDDVDWGDIDWDDPFDAVSSTETAKLEGIGIPSPTGGFFDMGDVCPKPPSYDISNEADDGGTDVDIGCSFGTTGALPVYLLTLLFIGLRKKFRK